MKIPLRYQISEYDCGPTSMLNAVSYLFEREEIPVSEKSVSLTNEMILHFKHGGEGTI